ncbi:MAG: flagellar protein FlgN [Defluviitaleaceae bacterium]|nr:flagellar protein FlgN [Defluviitaleaceae bacterium]
MPSLIEEFITTLKNEFNNYDELLVLAKEKSNIIKSNNIDVLQKITWAETAILGKNQKLEQKREDIVKNIGIVLNYNPKELTITKISEIIENKEEIKELISIRDKLKETLEELKQRNEINKNLIKSSLEYIDFSVNMLRGEKAEPYFEEISTNNTSFFDTKG